jgi:sigma-B regulation protein RsbU (phosphoserine phosphatase)
VPVDAQSYGYFVADVSGHGLSAAFLTSAIKALLRQYTGPLFSVEDTMRGLDSVMRQVLGEEQYLTACYARLNRQTRRLSVVSAGHPPLVRVSQSGRVETVQMDGEPLGIFSSVVFQRKELRLALGDRFYLYSDGLIECAPNGNREEGLERLVAACLRHRAVPLEDAAQAIANDLRPEVGVPADDLLLLAVEVRA